MATADLSLRLVFTLDPDGRGVAGKLRDEYGEEQSFSSWVGLLSLLDAVEARALPAPATARQSTEQAA
jgi:hypothetical protein